MASAKVRTKIGETWIEVDCMSVKEAVQAISEYAEFFVEGECGLCKSRAVAPSHRVATRKETGDKFNFYEMECLDCGAKLSFGQNKDGVRLFPKRTDEQGNEKGSQGWHQYHATQPSGGF